MTENWGAEQEVTLRQQEEKPKEHEKNVDGELRLIDTSLLMGDPFYPMKCRFKRKSDLIPFPHLSLRVEKAF